VIINVEKNTGRIVDVGQEYDTRTHDNVEVGDQDLSRIEIGAGRLVYKGGEISAARQHPLSVEYVTLKSSEKFGAMHAHENDQLIFVFHGSVVVFNPVSDIDVAAGKSLLIPNGMEHVIMGRSAISFFLTAQL
jgi:mannose-6-phosphate isomerase-like protein (cupin superfamily)